MTTKRQKVKGYLALATGRVFTGWSFGADPEKAAGAANDAAPHKTRNSGEVVFNTSLTGYQEILTDPSYEGQIVAMTASHIGNYGVNDEDVESKKIYLSGFVVQEESATYSNWRASSSLHDYLLKNGVPGLSGIDVRALTRFLRTQGAVNGIISTDGRDLDALIRKAKAIPSLEGRDLASVVTGGKEYKWSEGSLELPSAAQTPLIKVAHKGAKYKVVVVDFGVKQNILRCLVDRGCDVTVVPASATSDDILKHKPDGVMLSNGPGDPAAVTTGIKAIQGLVKQSEDAVKKGQKPTPLFGICLGHQLMGLALGGTTFKLKFGHHGANHPIKDLEHGNVDITTQNHGFAVEGEAGTKGEMLIKGNKDAIVTHVNLNDQSVAGLRHRTLPLFSVQYHPEASSGPHDAQHLFDRFVGLMEKNRS